MRKIRSFLTSQAGLGQYLSFIALGMFILVVHRFFDLINLFDGWNIASFIIAVLLLTVSLFMSAFWGQRSVSSTPPNQKVKK